jgi:hypothetical protein
MFAVVSLNCESIDLSMTVENGDPMLLMLMMSPMMVASLPVLAISTTNSLEMKSRTLLGTSAMSGTPSQNH